jgi:hypothetical protein
MSTETSKESDRRARLWLGRLTGLTFAVIASFALVDTIRYGADSILLALFQSTGLAGSILYLWGLEHVGTSRYAWGRFVGWAMMSVLAVVPTQIWLLLIPFSLLALVAILPRARPREPIKQPS